MHEKTTIQADTAERHKNKYENSNAIHRYVLDRFFNAVSEEIKNIAPKTTLEFGCGEGYFARRLMERRVSLGDYTGIDLRSDAIDHAQQILPDTEFRCMDLFEWPSQSEGFDLVIAAEVLEHLPDPIPYIEKLKSLTTRRMLLTVPHEPWFQLSNLVRGRDITRLGNHPEHVNKWNPRTFERFISQFVSVRKVITSFPFVILVAESSSTRSKDY